jgi:hypothetical protein
MNTKYSDVFELVLALMKTYEIDSIYAKSGENGITFFFIPYLKIASGELENANSGIDLSNRDDILCEFDEALSDGKQLIIAKYILIGYLSRETFDILQMKLHLQDGDFKTYAEKNNLDGKLNALYSLKEEVGYDVKKTGYNQYVW